MLLKDMAEAADTCILKCVRQRRHGPAWALTHHLQHLQCTEVL